MSGKAFTLQVGQIFHLWCYICTPQKFKFFVVAQIEPRMRYFIINSEIPNFILSKGKGPMLASQVMLCEKEYAFLTHDSYIGCHQIIGGYTAQELESEYTQNHKIYVANLHKNSRAHVRKVIIESELLNPREIEELLRVW